MKKKNIIIIVLMIALVVGAICSYTLVPSVKNYVDNLIFNKDTKVADNDTNLTEEEIEQEYVSLLEKTVIVGENDSYYVYFLNSKYLSEIDFTKENIDVDLKITDKGIYDITPKADTELAEDEETETNEETKVAPRLLYVGNSDEIKDVMSGLTNKTLVVFDGRLVAQSTLDVNEARANEEAQDKKDNTVTKYNTVYAGGGSSGGSSSSSSSGIDLSRYNGLSCSSGAELFLRDRGLPIGRQNGATMDSFCEECSLQVYDLLFWYQAPWDHEAVYIGNNQIFECGLGSDNHCAINSLRGGYYIKN